jgi:hypothetical protein
VIKAEERTYTVELTDRNTGQTTVIKDVPNEVERNVDVSASFEFLGQNLPASSSAAGGE